MIELGSVPLGVFKSFDVCSDRLRAAGCKIGPYAELILKNMPYQATEISVPVVAVTNEDLGLHHATYIESYMRAYERGFFQVLPEVGAALRIMPEHFRCTEIFTIAMRPSRIDHQLRMLTVECSAPGIPWLSTILASPEGESGTWGADKIWVFTRSIIASEPHRQKTASRKLHRLAA